MSVSQLDSHLTRPGIEKELAVQRKRRKRSTATGATEDCFTCVGQSIKCDRSRPYCSQCLQGGRDCLGYKTRLTWGVGVASRGKLRGLTLPVASTIKASGSITTGGTKSKKKQATANLATVSNDSAGTNTGPILLNPAEFDSSSESHPPADAFSSSWQMQWSSHDQDRASTSPDQENITIEASSLTFNIRDGAFPSPLSQDKNSPEHDYSSALNVIASGQMTPISYAARTPDSSYLGQTGPLESSVVTTSLRLQTTQNNQPSTFAFGSAAHTDLQPDQQFTPINPNKRHVYPDQFGRQIFAESYSNSAESDQSNNDIEYVQRIQPPLDLTILGNGISHSTPLLFNYDLGLSPFSAFGGIGKTPRMQYLINYYTEVISPVIVAFDGPNNPYRNSILRLAAQNETLQHAISALSASNLRQRRETGALSTGKTDPARRSSMAHLTLTDEASNSMTLLTPQEQAREETFHKCYAIWSLNQQLAHPVVRKDDSVLATLLILCLFHICDSGVAKFQTQFAGVKKLLNMRSNEFNLKSPDTKWFTRMFTWFDAMTASVNDREGQLQGQHLDISALADEEWALENLAGCDGQLFKVIAQLGRLNVLSQGKPVESTPTVVSRPLPMTLPGKVHPMHQGIEWTPLYDDEDLFSMKTAESQIQTQFWREWREIRHKLQTWQLDTTALNSSTPDAPYLTQSQQVDLLHISNSFRYSALLYTERLAYPSALSTSPNIQTWVQQGLNSIKQVKSDVYLLWPLFIVGSECVDEADRSIIRERCLDIQKDSGFLNNKSCLELLEKVWLVNNEYSMGGTTTSDTYGFRFSNVMKAEGNEGEYIVV